MSQIINMDWRECLKDSPKFRALIHEHEKDIDLFENHLEKVIKFSDCLVDHSKTFQLAYNNFYGAFQTLMVHFKDDPQLLEAIGKFNETSTFWHLNYQCMLEKCYNNISRVLSNLVKTDVKKVKEVRKAFYKGSEDVDNAFAKNAQVSKSRRDECLEANSNLSICRNNFKKTSLDYVYELNNVQMKKKMQMLSCLSSHFESQECFLKQMNNTFDSLKPYIELMNENLQELQENVTSTKKQVKDEIDLALKNDMQSSLRDSQKINIEDLDQNKDDNCIDGVSMEGYLYKRTSNAFKSWVRRWFIVENNQLSYCSQHRSRDDKVVLEKDLRLCNVVSFEDTERRFCFQVVSPVRSHLLQADNELDCKQWIDSIQEAARKAYNKMTTPDTTTRSLSTVEMRAPSHSPFRPQTSRLPSTQPLLKSNQQMMEVVSLPGNDECCDCGQFTPKWASFNLGITLCIECSGIHRSFGVHKSKVRSINLDAWEAEQVKVMSSLGNLIVNRIFEYSVGHSSVTKATPGCNREVREAWIKEKYVKKSFIRSKCPNVTITKSSQSKLPNNIDLPSESNFVDMPNNDITNSDHTTIDADVCFESSDTYAPEKSKNSVDVWLEMDMREGVSELLCVAAQEGSLPGMLRCLAEGADVNFKGSAGKTPLMFSIYSNELAPVEFLLLNGAKVDIVDDSKKSSLHHAALLGNASQIYLLLKRKVNQHLKDVDDKDALSIAIDKADANVVTLLRLARLNEEMRNSEGGFDNANEDMFAEVFKDFSTIDTKPVQFESNSNVTNGNTAVGNKESSNIPTLSNVAKKDNIVITKSDSLLEKSTSSNTSLPQCNEIVINPSYNYL